MKNYLLLILLLLVAGCQKHEPLKTGPVTVKDSVIKDSVIRITLPSADPVDIYLGKYQCTIYEVHTAANIQKTYDSIVSVIKYGKDAILFFNGACKYYSNDSFKSMYSGGPELGIDFDLQNGTLYYHYRLYQYSGSTGWHSIDSFIIHGTKIK